MTASTIATTAAQNGHHPQAAETLVSADSPMNLIRLNLRKGANPCPTSTAQPSRPESVRLFHHR
jgi:hypothetical protein